MAFERPLSNGMLEIIFLLARQESVLAQQVLHGLALRTSKRVLAPALHLCIGILKVQVLANEKRVPSFDHVARGRSMTPSNSTLASAKPCREI